MRFQRINKVGVYTSLSEVWEDHPEGGREGDWLVIRAEGNSVGQVMFWNKYTGQWTTATEYDPGEGGGTEPGGGGDTPSGDGSGTEPGVGAYNDTELRRRMAEAEDDINTLGGEVAALKRGKQDKLIAGQGISINGNVISSTGGGAAPSGEVQSPSGKFYRIDAAAWGLTKAAGAPVRGAHYSDEEYETMHYNAVGIENAINHAYQNGFNGVILDRGDYWLIPENIYNARPLPCINVFDKENFTIDLNGAVLHLVVDSSANNPYYNNKQADGAVLPAYAVCGSMFLLSCCDGVTVCNGVLRGDAHTRSFAVASEAWQEDTYGISTGAYCYNTHIHHMDVSGFMGDGISTGSSGTDVVLRDPGDGYRYNTSYNRHLVKNNTAGGYPLGRADSGDTARMYSTAFAKEGSPVVHHCFKNVVSGTVSNYHHYGNMYYWFGGAGWNEDVRPLMIPASECLVSLYLDLREDNLNLVHGSYYDELLAGGYDNAYQIEKIDSVQGRDGAYRDALDSAVIQKVISERRFSIINGAGANFYWPKVYILTYSIPDGVLSWSENGTSYTYDLRTLAVKKNGGTVSNSNDEYYAIVKKAHSPMLLKPSRVIECSSHSDFRLQGDETHVRMQLFYNHCYYGDAAAMKDVNGVPYPSDGNNNVLGLNSDLDQFYPSNKFKGASGEAISLSSGLGIIGKNLRIIVGENRGMLIESCYIHDNFRGGVTGGISELEIRNCRFDKKLRVGALGGVINESGEIPRFADPTNYHLDIEEGFNCKTEVHHCLIGFGNIFALSGMSFSFHDNHCQSSIQVRNMLFSEFHHNVFNRGNVTIGFWKLCSAIEAPRGANDDPEEVGANAEMESDGIGDLPGYVDKRNTGASRMERVVDVHDNIFYSYKWRIYRYLWKTCLNFHDNTLYLDEVIHGNWRAYYTQLDTMIECLKGSRFDRNRVVLNASTFDADVQDAAANNDVGIRTSFPILGSSTGNTFVNKGGTAEVFAVAPLGMGMGNRMKCGHLRLGSRVHSTSLGYRYGGVERFEGFTIEGLAKIYTHFGDPTSKVVIKDCDFLSDVVNGGCTSYIHSLEGNGSADAYPLPPVITVSGTSADKSRVVTLANDPASASAFAQESPGDGLYPRIFYSLDGCTWKQYEGPFTVYESATVSAYSLRTSGATMAERVHSVYTYRNIVVNSPAYDAEGNLVTLDYDQHEYTDNTTYPEVVGGVITYEMRFVRCTFRKAPVLPTSVSHTGGDYTARLRVVFDRCDFTACDGVMPSSTPNVDVVYESCYTNQP